MMLTALIAAIVTMLYLGLAINVIRGRRHYSIGLGDGGNVDLQNRIRAHANFNEYAPLFLILLGIAEQMAIANWLCALLAVGFIAGRVSHAYGLLVAEPLRQFYQPRMIGMMLTFATLGLLVVVLLVKIF
jgi:uncharacterized protein